MSLHAIERAAERYGLHISFAEMRKITKRLIDGEGVLKKTPQGTVEDRYITTSEGVHILARFHVASGTVVTILPATNYQHRPDRHRRVGNHKRSGIPGKLRREGRRPEIAFEF